MRTMIVLTLVQILVFAPVTTQATCQFLQKAVQKALTDPGSPLEPGLISGNYLGGAALPTQQVRKMGQQGTFAIAKSELGNGETVYGVIKLKRPTVSGRVAGDTLQGPVQLDAKATNVFGGSIETMGGKSFMRVPNQQQTLKGAHAFDSTGNPVRVDFDARFGKGKNAGEVLDSIKFKDGSEFDIVDADAYAIAHKLKGQGFDNAKVFKATKGDGLEVTWIEYGSGVNESAIYGQYGKIVRGKPVDVHNYHEIEPVDFYGGEVFYPAQ